MKHLIKITGILCVSLVLGLLVRKATAQCLNNSQFYITQIEGCEDGGIVLEAVTNNNFAGWYVISGSENSVKGPFNKITQVNPEVTTVYEAHVDLGKTNQIENGDFEDGYNEFTTDFIYTDTINTQGVFTLATSSVDSSFVHKNDHTSGTGLMFIADGSKFSYKAIYSIEVELEKGKEYNFSFWMANNHISFLSDSDDESKVSVQPSIHINDVMVYDELLPEDTSWTKIEYVWTEETGGIKTIAIKNLTTTKKGNDFVLDDVALISKCSQKEQIKIEPCNISETFSPNDDGLKDTYFIPDSGTAKIYNVNGAEVTRLNTPAYWYGTDRYGNELQGGYYVIVVNDSVVHRVTLIR